MLALPSGDGCLPFTGAIVRFDNRGQALDTVTSLDKFRVPLGNQEIELQQFVFEAGGMPLLRTRIREASRFTIFDIDPVTAARWGKVLCEWAAAQPGMPGRDGEAV